MDRGDEIFGKPPRLVHAATVTQSCSYDKQRSLPRLVRGMIQAPLDHHEY